MAKTIATKEPWQLAPDEFVRANRNQFLKAEQDAEKAILELFGELEVKLQAIIIRYSDKNGLILKNGRKKIEFEIKNTMIWFAGELECIVRDGIEEGAEISITGERKAHALYLHKAMELLPPQGAQRLLKLIRGDG